MPFQLDAEGNVVAKIDGVEVKYSPAEFERHLAELQKGESASKRFEAAARLRDEADAKKAEAESLNRKVADWLRKSDEGDPDAYEQLVKISGYTGREAEEKVARYREVWDEYKRQAAGETEEPETQSRTLQHRSGESRKRVGFDDLDPKLAQALQDVVGARVKEEKAQKRETVYDEMVRALDSDATLRRIVSKGGPRAERLKGLAKEKVKSRIRDGEDYDGNPTGVRQAVVKELRELVDEFGLNGTGDTTSALGLGPGPGISYAETQAEKPPTLLSLDDPNYGRSLNAKVAWEMENG